MKIRILIVSVIITAICGCQGPSKIDEIQTIDLTSYTFPEKNIGLSQIADSIEYVVLETNKDCLISEVSKCIVTDSLLLIFDRRLSSLFVFTRNGEFLRKISQQGGGPLEYNKLQSISLDQGKGLINLLTFSKEIKTFDLYGNYVGTRKMNDFCLSIHNVGDHLIATYPYPYKLVTNNLFGVINKKGAVTQKFVYQTNPFIKDEDDLPYCQSYLVGDTLCFWEKYCDTVYSINSRLQVAPRWIFKYDKDSDAKSKYLKIISRDTKEGINFIGFIEDSNRLFLLTSLRRYRTFLIYDKRTKDICKPIPDNTLSSYGFTNDIDGGFPFWPKFSDDHILIDVQEVQNLKKGLLESGFLKNSKCKDENKRSLLINILETTSNESNPILILVHLK